MKLQLVWLDEQKRFKYLGIRDKITRLSTTATRLGSISSSKAPVKFHKARQKFKKKTRFFCKSQNKGLHLAQQQADLMLKNLTVIARPEIELVNIISPLTLEAMAKKS